MEKVQITFALIILIALLGIINAQQRKRVGVNIEYTIFIHQYFVLVF
jgi:hypothetical protein